MINHSGKYTIFPTEMGWMGFISSTRGVLSSVLPRATKDKAKSELLSRVNFIPEFSPGDYRELTADLQAYFRGECLDIRCKLDWTWATPFQKRVLRRVSQIPRGSVLSYGKVAADIGLPGGARSVGRALASNMLPVIIPCHRVIRKNGALGGFTGAGLDVKARLLFLEGYIPS